MFTMRKSSKNRSEDDVVSSTNESVVEEEPNVSLRDSKNESGNENGDNDADETSSDNSKSISKKLKSAKGKTGKNKKNALNTENSGDENGEEDADDANSDTSKVTPRKGRINKKNSVKNKKLTPNFDKSGDENGEDGEENNSDVKKGRAAKSKGINKRKSNQHDDTNQDNKSEDEDDVSTSKKSKQNKSSKPKNKKSNVDEEENAEEYEVEQIIESKKIKGKLHYLIRWKGYSSSSDTWEPANTVSCPDLISKFNEQSGSQHEKTTKSPKGKKKKASKDSTTPSKRAKTVWNEEDADEDAEYEVDRIIEVRFKKNGQREFLIHWKGWSNKFDSWEPEAHLNCDDLINKFMEKVAAIHTKEPKSLRVAPETTNRFTLQDPTTGRRLSKRRGQNQRVRYDNAE